MEDKDEDTPNASCHTGRDGNVHDGIEVRRRSGSCSDVNTTQTFGETAIVDYHARNEYPKQPSNIR